MLALPTRRQNFHSTREGNLEQSLRSHLYSINLNTDQYSTPPKPNQVDYSLTINITIVSHARQQPQKEKNTLYT